VCEEGAGGWKSLEGAAAAAAAVAAGSPENGWQAEASRPPTSLE